MATQDKHSITFTSAILQVAELGVSRPPVSLGYGGDWGTGWMSPGGYEGGVEIKLENTLAPKVDDRFLGKVGDIITEKKAMMSVTLNYYTLENLNKAWGGVLTEVAAVVGVPAYQHLRIGSETGVKNWQWGAEGYWDDNGVIRPTRAIGIGNGLKGASVVMDRKKQIGIKLDIEFVFDDSIAGGLLLDVWRHIGDAL